MRRVLGVHRLSRGPTGRTIVFSHPAPGSGNLDPDPTVTSERGVSLIGVDRPGYGDSSPLGDDEWATVDSAADDLARVLLGEATPPVGAVGWDAGGRVVLALSARRPDLVDRAVVVATPAPHEEVPWLPADVAEALSSLGGASADVARRRLETVLQEQVPRSWNSDAVTGLLHRSAADDAVLERAQTTHMPVEMLKAGFAQGVRGYASDVAGFSLRPWGFDPQNVKAKTLLLYGSKDPLCASRHGNWWQRHLPNARLEMVPGAGHLLLFALWPRVLSHLAPGLKRVK